MSKEPSRVEYIKSKFASADFTLEEASDLIAFIGLKARPAMRAGYEEAGRLLQEAVIAATGRISQDQAERMLGLLKRHHNVSELLRDGKSTAYTPTLDDETTDLITEIESGRRD